MTLCVAERQSRKECVLELRQQGCRNQEIAEKSGLGFGTVQDITGELIREGKIESYRKGLKRGPRRLLDLTNERVLKIILLRRKYATNKEIGRALNISGERARQLINRIAKVHGEAVFEPDEHLWTLAQAAKIVGVPRLTVSRLCRSKKIPCRRRPSTTDQSTYLLDTVGLETLRGHARIGGSRTCIVCTKNFIYSGTNQLTCSAPCKKIRESTCREKSLNDPPSCDTLRGWYKGLWAKLQNYTLPKDEDWLTFSQALQRTEVSAIQLSWLRRRRVVHTIPGPINSFGRATSFYAASEMEIVRQVYQTWRKKNAKQ